MRPSRRSLPLLYCPDEQTSANVVDLAARREGKP